MGAGTGTCTGTGANQTIVNLYVNVPIPLRPLRGFARESGPHFPLQQAARQRAGAMAGRSVDRVRGDYLT